VSEAKITRREWRVKILLWDDETETIAKQYADTIKYRPDQLDVTVAECSGDLRVAQVDISGDRILKDGSRSARVGETYRSYWTDLPERFQREIANALSIVKGEILDD
jgi:hypothetical protein